MVMHIKTNVGLSFGSLKKRTINATETSENMNVSSPPFRSCQSDYP